MPIRLNGEIQVVFLKQGYPEPLRLVDIKEARLWHEDYIDAILNRDLKDITNIRTQYQPIFPK